MYKGLFWLADDGGLITYRISCGADGTPEAADLPYNSRKGDSFTHKATWEEAAREQPRAVRSKPWNHFPRGRVEIKAGKVTVYHHPALGSPEFEQRIRGAFALDGVPSLEVRFISDHSNHYKAANGL
ncbi:MAG: hypothetical protein LBL26_02285 [Peptococcaceae bacterium]|nr:hypothetical protein [Peptococcaceae bacterium]